MGMSLYMLDIWGEFIPRIELGCCDWCTNEFYWVIVEQTIETRDVQGIGIPDKFWGNN